MLFFNKVIDEKFKDKPFSALYKKECHMCSATVRLVSEMEDNSPLLQQALSSLKIDPADFEALRDGDYCKPSQVVALFRYLGMDESDVTGRCQRYKEDGEN